MFPGSGKERPPDFEEVREKPEQKINKKSRPPIARSLLFLKK